MSHNLLKASVFLSFIFLLTLTGAIKSFAQDDNSPDDQAREEQTRQTLNQIHDLELKMEDNARRLDALEKAVNQSDAQTAADDNTTTQVVTSEQVVPLQAEPVRLASVQTSERPPSEIKAEPVDVLPRASIYYAPSTILPKVHTFELSQEDFYSSFKEKGNYEVYKKSGPFFGINMAYTYRPIDSEMWPINVFHLETHGDYGLLDYNYEGDRVDHVSNYIVEPRAWIGKEFNFSSNVSLTPYVGGGYRWYYDDLKNKSDDAGDGGFNIQTQYVYIPVGMTFSVRPMDGWRMDTNAEYDYLVWGRVNNYLSNASPFVSNLSNTLKNGYGLRGSIKFVKEGDNVNYFFEPYIRYWQIKASKTSEIVAFGVPFAPYQEDKNNTTEIGARVGVEF